MRVKSISLLAALIGACLLGLSPLAHALKPKDITPAEMALLPRFCPDTQGFKYGDAYYRTSPNAAKWVGLMGKGFWHMHHYCWAIISFHRAERLTMPRDYRLALLQDVRGDFWYVVNNTGPDFILLPEIFTWIGRTEVLLRRPAEAMEAFAKARSLKPDYWPPYFHWAEFLQANGKRQEALEVVKAGLQYSPDAKALLLLFRHLGGKPADMPPPVPKPAAPAAGEAQAVEKPATEEVRAAPPPSAGSPN